MEWQAIETAPEGNILVYMPNERESHRIHTAQWHENVKIIGGVFAFDRTPATHWMPLPAPPSPTSPNQPKPARSGTEGGGA